MIRRLLCVLLLVAPAASAACKKEEKKPPETKPVVPPAPEPKVELPPAPPIPEAPAGLDGVKMNVPADNPMTPEKVELGKLLFFDKRLSKDGSASCETCHVHEKGWTDGLPLSTKVGGQVNTRHTPTLYNVAYQSLWYWDGRAPTLEDQITAAWKGQMGAEPDKVAAALAGIPEYKAHFQRAFQSDPSAKNIAQALASFVRTLRSGGSAWDQFEKSKDKALVSEDAIKGYKIFTEKAGCAVCHAPPLYTDLNFHNTGVGYNDPKGEPADIGRGKQAPDDPTMKGAFKTPTLRSVTKSAPYFHDGSVATIEEAVVFMAGGGRPNPSLDKNLHAAKLKPAETAQLLEFLKALDSPEKFEKPTKLPE
jgi:cytochrome c peroxidase